jgi:DNA-binding PadR family transcriptional regulator
MSIPRLSPKEALILRHLITKGEAYGLELVRESEGQLKRGTVYVTLGRMADKGLVESEEIPRDDGSGLNARVFRPTGHGARVLKALDLASASMALAWEGA